MLQATEALFEITNNGRGGREKPRIVRYAPGEERKSTSAESLLKRGRCDAGAPVPEVSPVSSVTVMKLIWMENDDLTGQRMAPRSAVGKALHTRNGYGDGVCVVPV